MNTVPGMPLNGNDLTAIVLNNLAPQLKLTQNVLFYSQALIGDYKYSARHEAMTILVGWSATAASSIGRHTPRCSI